MWLLGETKICILSCPGMSPKCRALPRPNSKQIYRMHENEKKRIYTRHLTYIEQGTFTPLIFTTTGGMGEKCWRYHSRLTELLANKKGEVYSKTMACTRAKISFSILRYALLCLRGSRVLRRVHCNAKDIDLDIYFFLKLFRKKSKSYFTLMKTLTKIQGLVAKIPKRLYSLSWQISKPNGI